MHPFLELKLVELQFWIVAAGQSQTCKCSINHQGYFLTKIIVPERKKRKIFIFQKISTCFSSFVVQGEDVKILNQPLYSYYHEKTWRINISIKLCNLWFLKVQSQAWLVYGATPLQNNTEILGPVPLLFNFLSFPPIQSQISQVSYNSSHSSK